MAKISVPFHNDQQKQTLWCWVAVAANAYNSLKPQTSPNIRQCEVAQIVMDGDQCNAPVNEIRILADALDAVGIRDHGPEDPDLDFLLNELAPGRGSDHEVEPVCAKIRWNGDQGGIHFIAVSGADPDMGDGHVFVEDPYLGPGNAIEYDLHDFTSSYAANDPNYPPPRTARGTVVAFQRVVRPPVLDV